MRLALAVLLATASLSSAADAGTLVVSGDEWTISNSAYLGAQAAGTSALVSDLTARFGGTNYLLLTGNGNVGSAALTSLTAQLQGAGKTVTQLADIPASLAGYDAVFHFGQAANPSDFQSFVLSGGSAYISLGAGYYGTAAGEAAHWNAMLASFGLSAGSSWFTAPGLVTASVTTGPAGVESLLWGYGQSVDPVGATGQSYVRGRFEGSDADVGLLAFVSTASAVPEPSSWALMIAGFGAVGTAMRKRKGTRLRFA